MNRTVIPRAQISVVIIGVLLSLCVGCVMDDTSGEAATLINESDPFVTIGDAEERYTTVPEETTVPVETTAAEAVTTPLSTLRVQALTGYPIPPIHEQLPNYHQLPEYIAWDGVIYKRLGMYISDEEGDELESRGSYTWWSYENWSGQLISHEEIIRLYSVGELPSSACVATNFDIFASGSRAVYVNEAEWTEEMQEAIEARAVKTS